MTNFDNLDLEKGAVLDSDDALEFLKQCAYEQYKEAMEGDIDGLEAILQDIKDNIEYIERDEHVYFKITQHPMAASGIIVTPMEEAK